MDPTGEHRFVVEWSVRGNIKWVAITDVDTGRRAVGRDWFDWDQAYHRAMRGLAAERRAA